VEDTFKVVNTTTKLYKREDHRVTRKSLGEMNAPHMPVVYRRQNLYSNTNCTPRHDKENHLWWQKI